MIKIGSFFFLKFFTSSRAKILHYLCLVHDNSSAIYCSLETVVCQKSDICSKKSEIKRVTMVKKSDCHPKIVRVDGYAILSVVA